VVWLPALYEEVPDLTDAQRLGRETDWREAAPGLTLGVGQRLFLAGETGVAAMELVQLDFAP
jgi:type VI secretion system protein ImpE